jgi:hypothetical protein
MAFLSFVSINLPPAVLADQHAQDRKRPVTPSWRAPENGFTK